MKRAYGSEPVLLSASPVTTPTLSTAKPAKRKWRFIVGSASLAVVVLIVIVLYFVDRSPGDAIPVGIRTSANFPLYQPRRLPDGFRVDPNSFHASQGIVTFAILYGHGKSLAVSEQAKPEVDLQSFYSQFTNDKTTTTNIGKAVIGEFNNSDVASVTADHTWILLRATSGIDRDELQKIAEGMGN